MFRVVFCVVACAVPLVMSTSAGAQSYVSVAGETDIAPAASSAPMSITQRYVPQSSSSSRELSLLVDESQPVMQPAPMASAQIASSSPPRETRMAIDDLGIGRAVITVSNVRGLNRE